jgi:hypothetical protein
VHFKRGTWFDGFQDVRRLWNVVEQMIGPEVRSNSKRDLSLSMGKAYLYVSIFVIPVLILLCGFYLWLWGVESFLDGFMRLTDWSIIIPVLILGVPLHELIHGITWALAGRMKLGEIRFGFQLRTLTPYAHCRIPVRASVYRIGGATPLLLMGILPYLIGLCFGNGLLAAFGLIFILAAGGDVVILWLIRRVNGTALVEDHPSRAGCYVYEEA